MRATTLFVLVNGLMFLIWPRALALPFRDPVAHETVTRQARRLPGEKFDSQEGNARLRTVFAEADAQAERATANVPRNRDFIFRFWAAKKKILRAKNRIDWRTPAELNPTIAYDSYGQPRLTAREIREITPLVEKQVGNGTEKIESFERTFDGTIYVWTRVGTDERGRYVVRRESTGWKVVERHRVQR